MAISKKTGREYQSRRERGYKPSRRSARRVKFPKRYDRWGQPAICGVIDPDTGKECDQPSASPACRCEYHEELAQELTRAAPSADAVERST
ncbi:MAG: hypothetical protein ACLFRT_15340 [Actinomycetota bacterium]